MGLSVELAVAKTHKYASRESGDTVEIVERPGGGMSAVLVDAQGSGLGAKLLSLQIAGRAISLLNEGVRDGAAARAAHDYLFAIRSGKVSAELDIASIDLASRSFLVTKNSETPLLVRRDGNGEIERLKDSGGRIGLYRRTRPRVLEFPLALGSLAILVSDGVAHAGSIRTSRLPLIETAQGVLAQVETAQDVADGMLDAAIEADRRRPADDLTVVVLRAYEADEDHLVRRMTMSFPVAG